VFVLDHRNTLALIVITSSTVAAVLANASLPVIIVVIEDPTTNLALRVRALIVLVFGTITLEIIVDHVH
jgi:hypothetical protein